MEDLRICDVPPENLRRGDIRRETLRLVREIKKHLDQSSSPVYGRSPVNDMIDWKRFVDKTQEVVRLRQRVRGLEKDLSDARAFKAPPTKTSLMERVAVNERVCEVERDLGRLEEANAALVRRNERLDRQLLMERDQRKKGADIQATAVDRIKRDSYYQENQNLKDAIGRLQFQLRACSAATPETLLEQETWGESPLRTRIRRLVNQVDDLKKLRTTHNRTIRHLKRDLEEQTERVCRYAEEAMHANEARCRIRMGVDLGLAPDTIVFVDKDGKLLSTTINVGKE